MKSVVPAVAVLFSMAISGWFVFVAASREFTQLENALLQLFILASGLAGSFWIGRQSARQIIRPHARSAFRRLTSLYHSLSAVANTVETTHDMESVEEYQKALALIEGLMYSQLSIADDALEDWREIVPEDVSDLRRGLDSTVSREE